MLKTKRNSPGPETKFAPESKFGAKKKRHLHRIQKRSTVKSVGASVAQINARRKRPLRPIRNLAEALTMTSKGLYLRAHRAKTAEEREQYLEWARKRTRWEFEVGIRKLPPKKSAAA